MKVIGEKNDGIGLMSITYTIFKLKNSELVNAKYPVYTDVCKTVCRDESSIIMGGHFAIARFSDVIWRENQW